jgi:antitoxin component YwqK of YwqJK toxin-antitoxin module
MKQLFMLLLICGPGLLYAQKMPDYGIHQIRINDTDKTIRAEIQPVTSMPNVNPELTYYWYGTGSIHPLQGGFSGQLLNGSYEEYYLNKNLKTQGTFEKGLKNGVWKDWDESGKLTRLFTWENGCWSGPFTLYNTRGQVIQSGRYVHNQLDGPVSFNAGTDSARTILYKKGRVVPPKSGTFLKRINIFKKKKTPPAKPAS